MNSAARGPNSLLKAAPGDIKCRADSFAFPIGDKKVQHGIVTRHLAFHRDTLLNPPHCWMKEK